MLAPFAEVIVERFGDIWLRDTGPIVLGSGQSRRTQGFGFNGWGGKYELPGDQDIGDRLARRAGLPFVKAEWVLEGGAIDGDGSGVVVTTEQCLLNPNRNSLTRDQIEGRLQADLGFSQFVWLGSGLLNDHTDGHVDNLARFVAPGRIAIPTPAREDPNESVYRDAARRLRSTKLDLVTLPSPGRVLDEDGDVIPASYMNFYIGNAVVVVPHYGAANDRAAVEVVQALFPDRVAIGLRADHILTGGGSFHCISQQVPA
jgi:agmatine deiminase